MIRWLAGLGGVLLLAFALVAVLPGPLPVAQGAPGAQGDSLPPIVVDTSPLAGEELPLDGAVTLYFDQAMDRAAVEGAFSVSPDVAGTLAWTDDTTLVFTPSEDYARATEYTFTLGAGAASAQGVTLAEPFALSLQTIGYLEVSEVLPASDSTDVETSAVFTVIFNRPVVPLVAAEDMGDLPQPLVFDPPVEGEGEWLNTSIYTFTPADGLRGGTTYTVTIPAGLEDVTGGVLQDDYTWTFSTVAPRVTSVSPSDGSQPVVLETPVTVEFSQSMDEAATEAAFSLGRVNTVDETQLPVPVEGTFEWSLGGTKLTFQPDAMLGLGETYLMTMDAGVARSATGAQLNESYQTTFSTVPAPAIVYTSPQDGEQAAYPYGGFTIQFAGPMDLDSLEDKVIIEPEPWREFDTYFYDYDYSYQLSFDTEPSTEYVITILPGMMDRYGNTIDEGMVVRYRTDTYPPELTLQTAGTAGLYSAYNPTTRVFLTHRNISRADLRLWHVSLPTLADLTGANRWDNWGTFAPNSSDLLREWSIELSSQQDQLRYDLLYISDTGPSGISNVQCLGAPESQIAVGDVAIVTQEDQRPLNVRQEPNLTAQTLTQALPGDTFQVIDGPLCEGGYLWWQVRLDNGSVGWAAEGDQQNYYFAPLTAAPQDPNLPTGDGETQPDPLAPGAYYLEVSAPEMATQGYDPIQHLMIVSNVNITLKYSQDMVMAWVTDLESGEPVSGASVIFYNLAFNPVAQAVTDDDGLAVASIPHQGDLYGTMFAAVNRDGLFGFSNSEWADGISPWQFEVSADYEPENLLAYLYTDRPIYRPDQPVYFRGVIRDRDDVTYTVPALSEVPVKIYDDRGEVIYDQILPVTAEGSFSGELLLDANAPLGYYRIVAEVASNNRDSFGVSFSVAEYRAPEFQVNVTPEQTEVAQGDTIRVLVESSYFFGGAVSDADVSYSVLSKSYYFNYSGPGYWSFVDNNYDNYAPEYYGPNGEVVEEGQGRTDAMGRYLIEIPAELGDQDGSRTYTIEARVTDESDQLVAGRVEVVVHQGLVYVGLQPEEYVGQAEQENTVNVLAVDWDSNPIADQVVEYEVVERRWFSVQEEDELGRTVWTWDVEENPVEGASGTVTTDEDGLAHVVFTPPAGGVYKVYAHATDAAGNEVTSSAFMWVSGSDFVNWRQENSNRIQLITDKDEYEVGDTAEILIASPWQGTAYALITVERGDILTHEVLRLDTNSTVYRLPITPDFAPNVFVSVMLVKGVDENNPTAAFRMGLTQLNVDTSRLVMDLEVTPNVDVAAGEFAGPGDTVEYTIKATDWQGSPVPNAEIGVGLTDLAVLTIADANSADLLPYFYSERGVSVVTALPLTISVDQATQVIIDTIKGGGGGYGEGGIFDVRQEFVDTPLWAPDLITDENGEATVSVVLPDNLTTWRLDARAVTTGADGPMLVGQTTSDLLSTKPVLIRPVTPRFFVVGDQTMLAAVVNNNTDEPLVAEVTLEGTGFRVADGTDLTQTVSIPAKGRVRVNWEIEILDVGGIDATFYANADDGAYTDASKPPLGQGDEQTLPVYKYEVPETVGTAGTLYGPEASSRTEAVVLPHRFAVTEGDLTIRLDRSLAAATIDGLAWLRNFPHYCIEQIISRFLPNAITYRALQDLDVDNAELEANLSVQVNYALQRLYAQQKVDGGWGWFPQDESNPIVTAYAIIGLVEAQNAGYAIDQDVLAKAIEFVQGSLIDVRQADTTWRLNRQAFLLYALARAGYTDVSRTVQLYEQRDVMHYYARAYLAMTFYLIDPGDSRAMELINDLNNGLIVSATGAHWEEETADWYNWNTDTRTTALGLMAMVQIDPENQMIPNVVRWLMVARDADHWETTQETAWSVMALTEWMVVSGELHPDYTFGVSLNGDSLPLGDDTATSDNVKDTETLRVEVADLLQDQANAVTISRSAGEGNLYYTAHLTAYLPVPEVEALDRGIILVRKYSLVGDPDAAPIESAAVGEAVQVSLTIIAPSDLHYVVIEDPIPAGADAVDTQLNTTSTVGTQPELNRARPLSQGWGWWWFSNIEMRDEKVVLYATYLPRGTYQFNYVIQPGMAGVYNVIPATGQEFYFPEVYGRTAGTVFTITGGTESDALEPAEEPIATAEPEATDAAPDVVATAEATEEPTAEATVEATDAATAEAESTADATVSVTEEAAAALPLGERVQTDDGVSLRIPEGWTSVQRGSTFVIATDADVVELDVPPAGEFWIEVSTPEMTAQMLPDAATLDDVIDQFVQAVAEQEGTVVGEPETLDLDGPPGISLAVTLNDLHALVVALDMGEGQFVLLGGAASNAEDAARLRPTLLDIAASVEYAASPGTGEDAATAEATADAG
ncbi:Ig-like domain-containing protein [Aggregatilinea lenta]|uniref:Ig-like domain-containing protein n=1 Tax=Aggregatilinea lenta TaxID=913108 RepID=UPI0013C2A4B9|nr:Ig-like domain-containing protein [Aggregatilinea lenta]